MLKLAKDILLKIGTTPQMDGDLKLAIRVSNFFAFWSIFTIGFMAIYVFSFSDSPLVYLFLICILLDLFALWLNYKHLYHYGRPLLHLAGLAAVYFGNDALGLNAGYARYYLVNASIPFLIFSIKEQWRSVFFSSISVTVYIMQISIGDGAFIDRIPPLPGRPWVGPIGAIIFMIFVFIVFRWEMVLARREIEKQQAELVQNSNLMALGEMSAGIAHEINNPLQTLSLHNESLRRYVSRQENVPDNIKSHFQVIDRTIEKISALIKGLKELARDASNDRLQIFNPKTVIDDVMNVSHERIKYLGIDIHIEYSSDFQVKGQMVHLSQTLINLLNNSIDALEELQEKWIKIKVCDQKDFVRISVIDSGKGIPPEILHKIMRPFFTTKAPGKGTGLGLSISKSIIEKNGGLFYYNFNSENTCFVVELPRASDSK